MKCVLRRLAWCPLHTMLILLASMSAGCSSVLNDLRFGRDEPPALASPTAPRGAQVRVGGDGFALGDVEQPSLTPQQFVDLTNEHLRARRVTATVRFVQRYPDLAATVLSDSASARVSLQTLRMIAEAHDRQCVAAPPGAGWTALVSQRQANPQATADYDRTRIQFMSRLQNGQAREALALKLAAAVPPGLAPVLQIDAWRLQGIALLLDERPAEAAEAFDAARRTAGTEHPYQAANLTLLLSDALRRTGEGGGADRAWEEAAVLAGHLSLQAVPLVDPILWERVAYLRPAHAPWPGVVREQLTQLCGRHGLNPPPTNSVAHAGTETDSGEWQLWANIGHWRLVRAEPQAALVAWKRAESLTGDPRVADGLRLAQAKALTHLGLTPAATALLVALAAGDDPAVVRPALAMLGSLKLQQGGTAQGLQMLRRAVEEPPEVVWPERAEAAADLGLAYLLQGDEATGLRWLHQSQQDFEAAGHIEALTQSLENEAAYWDATHREELAQSIRGRLDMLSAIK